MNALVKKEIRLLLPAWIAALALAIAPGFVTFVATETFRNMGMEIFYALTKFFLPLGILILGISSFGQEFSFKTFSVLLSQPIPRKQVWLVKISALAFSLASVLLASVAAQLVFCLKFPAASPDLVSESEFTILVVLTFFSGGLWTTLLLRQVTAAFWFTLLAPGAIAVSISNLAGRFDWPEDRWAAVEIVVLSLYSVAGFFFARRLFLRAQDVQWTGGNILFPWRRRKSVQASSFVFGPFRNRFAVLVWKEIQLHEMNLFLAAALLALNLGAIIVHTHTANVSLKETLEFIPVLWVLMPLMIGAAAVAEERKLGTFEAQLCLPVRRTAQFSIKFFTGLVLSLILGASVPSLIEWTRNFGMTNLRDYWIFFAAPGLYFISFYASTLARSTLQAMGMALGIPVAVWAIVFGVAQLILSHFPPGDFYENNAQAGWMILALGVWGWLFLPLVLARLMFWNFKWLHRDWKMWRRNAAVVAIFFTLVVVLTNAIYFRMWELFQAKDYPHGAAQLGDSKSIKFSSGSDVISMILPDGRLWVETLAYRYGHILSGDWETVAFNQSKAKFIGSSNWTDVASGWRESLAIQSDGSLWGARQDVQLDGFYETISQTDFTRIGSETNWLHVAGKSVWNGFLLLKTDGSLWILGTNHDKAHIQMDAMNLKTSPARIGNETNWAELFTINYTAYAKKRDGSIWSWRQTWNVTNDFYGLARETNWDASWFTFNQYGVAIGTNGELWVARCQWENNNYVPKTKIQLGSGMKWKAAAAATSYGNAIIALRDDGTLWKSSQLWLLETAPEKIELTQLGNHSDWIALPSSWWGTALAADGSLWSWGQPNRYFFLAPSRKPEFLGNIFSKAN